MLKKTDFMLRVNFIPIKLGVRQRSLVIDHHYLVKAWLNAMKQKEMSYNHRKASSL